MFVDLYTYTLTHHQLVFVYFQKPSLLISLIVNKLTTSCGKQGYIFRTTLLLIKQVPLKEQWRRVRMVPLCRMHARVPCWNMTRLAWKYFELNNFRFFTRFKWRQLIAVLQSVFYIFVSVKNWETRIMKASSKVHLLK